MPQGREIELYLNTATGEFVHEVAHAGGVMDLEKLNLYAGEMLTVTIRLCQGEPLISESDGTLRNPDRNFSGNDVSGGIVVDNSYETYSNARLTESIAAGRGISRISAVVTGSVPRKFGYLYLSADEAVPYCDWEESPHGAELIFHTADEHFLPCDFVPTVDRDAAAPIRVVKQPLIVSGSADNSRSGEGIFQCTLDAANPVYEYYARGQNVISDCELQFTITRDGRPVMRARREVQCLGSLAAPEKFQYTALPDWSAADSRYLRRNDLHGGVLIQARGTSAERMAWDAPESGSGTWLQFWDTDQEMIYAGYYTGSYWDWGQGISIGGPRGLSIDASPVVSPIFREGAGGLFCRLDESFPVIEFASPIHDAAELAFWTVSDDPGTAGNIALSMQWNGQMTLPAVAIPVTAEECCTVLSLEGYSGSLRLRREADHEIDTLHNSSGAVTARITGFEVRFRRN